MAPKQRRKRLPRGEVELTAQRKASYKSSRPSYPSQTTNTSFIQPRTWQASALLIVAIVISVAWNVWSKESVDSSVRGFLGRMCPVCDCHPYLAPTRRTQRASRTIVAGQRLLTIPRNYTLWDIDALKDEWIHNELIETNSEMVSTSGASYLAVYLARLMDGVERFDKHSVMNTYIDSVLPNTMDDFQYHPICWADLKGLLHGTYAYDRIVAMRNGIRSEYDDFRKRSLSFSSQISWESYQVARLNVLTRSFGTGPLDMNPSELRFFQEKAGVDLSHGSHAMVPILDLYDHHAKPNVGFSYKEREEAFVIESVRTIAADSEIFDSYGKRTDSDLLAKYGFVNGDGSEHTDASIALWHSVEDTAVDPKVVLRYLQYDDGYSTCVSSSDAKGWALKQIKFQYIQRWATVPRRWVVRMPPRNSTSLPGKRSDQPITTKPPPPWDMRQLQFDGTWLFSTCRLLSLTHLDYDGTAYEMLEKNIANATFLLPPTKDALEFRTLMCIARMAQTALQKVGESTTWDTAVTFQSPDWIAAHIRLGESQTLKALRQTSFAGLQVFRDKMDDSSPEYSMRDTPCGPQFLVPLWKEQDEMRGS